MYIVELTTCLILLEGIRSRLLLKQLFDPLSDLRVLLFLIFKQKGLEKNHVKFWRFCIFSHASHFVWSMFPFTEQLWWSYYNPLTILLQSFPHFYAGWTIDVKFLHIYSPSLQSQNHSSQRSSIFAWQRWGIPNQQNRIKIRVNPVDEAPGKHLKISHVYFNRSLLYFIFVSTVINTQVINSWNQ